MVAGAKTRHLAPAQPKIVVRGANWLVFAPILFEMAVAGAKSCEFAPALPDGSIRLAPILMDFPSISRESCCIAVISRQSFGELEKLHEEN